MNEIVLGLVLRDEKAQRNAFHAVTTFRGIDKIAVDKEKRELKVVGTVDPVAVAEKLRELWPYTELLSVRLTKEPEKKEKAKKDEPKKVEPQKEKPKKEEPKKEKPKKVEAKKEKPKKDEPNPKKEKPKKVEAKKEKPKKEEPKKVFSK